ncbi:hypothetical protein BD560DRAFT_385679 [Blakeslea trispora]|nr:hypothetical protein BD560DRAFT_385679 [Blakeslea trispora]
MSSLPDAFSKTLESKPRNSYIAHLRQEQHTNNSAHSGTSTVNRLSRVFEASTHLEHTGYKPKPTPLTKTPSLRSPPIQEPRIKPEIDETSLDFKNIRARFQRDTSIQKPTIPLKPSMTGPPSPPEKIIVANKTGPPALPAKPKVTHHRYTEQNHRSYPQQTIDSPNETQQKGWQLSSSSLYLPSVIHRTATGNSSIISTTSTSSQTSNSTNSKRGWHISNWFSNQQQQQLDHEILKSSIKRSDTNETESLGTVSPQITGSSHSSKRTKVMNELLETEKTFQKDMTLLKEIYFDGAHHAGFSKSDIRYLFSNLTEIVEFEKTFVAMMEHTCEQDSVGVCFREMDCKEKIQGKTTSWDLGSLLIKPVQRVLKYPLLLREILALTPPTHDDYDNLLAAVKEIQDVADNINEIKRRKDIVEKIVGDKKRTEMSVEAYKKSTKIKQATGFAIEPTHDLLFEALNEKFEEQQEMVRQLAREVQGWVRHVKIGFENLQHLACSMETLYSSWGGVRVKSLTAVTDFSKMADHMYNNLARELDSDVRGYIYSRIDDFLKVFENPTQVINKRALKMIDYDRVRDMKLKGDVPDKALQESADAYVSINGQLVDELPKFFALTSQYIDILLGDLAFVQIKFNGLMQKEWKKLVEQNLGSQAAESYDTIIKAHTIQFDRVEELTNKITILNRNRYSTNQPSTSASLRTKSKISSSFKLGIDNDSSISSSIYSNNSAITSSSRTPTPITPITDNLIDVDYDNEAAQDFKCVVLYDFITDDHDQLSAKSGTVLWISQDPEFIDEEWWHATTLDDSNQSGWIPINYCKKL